MAPSSFFHKPELALRRAIELQGIHQEDAALTLLHEVLSSRRHRTWSPIYEQIMICYLDLCLEHHRSREAKDGLHQYRNLSQSQAPGSLEKVILYLVSKAETSCTEAKAYVDAQQLASDNAAAAAAAAAAATAASSTVADEEDDRDPNDDNPEGNGDDGGADGGGGFGGGSSPEAILLSTMSTDPAKSQRDSALLLPALKFLWETYRAVLDILRSNSKLEHVYHAAAQGALRFCRVYHRRMEFRHLCDMLRMHLGNLRQFGASNLDDVDGAAALSGKTSNKVRGWEGWTSDSIELYLQTRFAQLETASVLHRYMEGFRTVEDIYNILQISHARRKANPDAPAPKAKLMAAYYEKLTTLFWVSENYLFHGFAWYKFYTLCKEYNRGMSDDVKNLQASAVLLAALCIPQVPTGTGVSDTSMNQKSKQQQNQHGIRSTMEDDIVKQKMARMATLLGFHTRNPTREALLTEIRSKNILEQVPQYLRDLYFLLEETSDPLIMVEQARPLLEQLKNQEQTSMESSFYEETKEDPAAITYDESTSSLGRYVKPLTAVLLQKLIVNLAASYHTVSLDHLKKLTSGLEAFDLTFEQVEKAIVQFTLHATKSGSSLSVRIDHRANCLRFGEANLESELMRSQLTVLFKQLKKVSRILDVPHISVEKDRMEARMHRLITIRSTLLAEHQSILDRKNYIEECKEKAERLAQEKIKDELRSKAEEELARKLEEEKRMAREQKIREQEKLKRIQMELDNQEKKRFLVAMGKNTEGITEEQIAKIDTEALQKEHQEKMNKEKEEAERKTKEAAKKLDYLVRAIRIEELPLIKKQYEEKINQDRQQYEREIEEKAERARLQWEADVKDKSVLEEHAVFSHFAAFEGAIMIGRRLKHDKLCREAEQKAEVEAEKAKIRRARRRKEDEAKRKAEEAKRKQKEEEERIRKEDEAAKKKASEEAKRIQLQHEQEAAEAAAAAKVEEDRSSSAPAASSSGSATTPAPRGLGAIGNTGSAGGKYVPPSRRGAVTSGSNSSGPTGDRASGSYGDRASGSRFGGGSSGAGGGGSGGAYPGGGRYEGRRPAESSGGPGTDTWRGSSSGGGGAGERPRFGGDRRDGGGAASSGRDGGGDKRAEPRENSRWTR